jgi:hypothetical protein
LIAASSTLLTLLASCSLRSSMYSSPMEGSSTYTKTSSARVARTAQTLFGRRGSSPGDAESYCPRYCLRYSVSIPSYSTSVFCICTSILALTTTLLDQCLAYNRHFNISRSVRRVHSTKQALYPCSDAHRPGHHGSCTRSHERQGEGVITERPQPGSGSGLCLFHL